MPADFIGMARQAHHPVLAQRRRSERRLCSLEVRLRTASGEYAGRLLDVSAGGVGLRIDAVVPLRPGTDLVLVHQGLGEIRCQLRWAMHPRYGAEFAPGTPASAGLMAFYDTLPPSQAGDPA